MPDDEMDPSELMRDVVTQIERKETWVRQFRELLEKKEMTEVAHTHDRYVEVVALEFLTPENSPLPSAQAIEALLLRVAADCGREFAPRGMLILTAIPADQRRCKTMFKLERRSAKGR